MAIKINNTTVIDDSRNLTNLGSAIAVSQGGTGATDAASARSNLAALSKAGGTVNGSLTVAGRVNFTDDSYIDSQRMRLRSSNGSAYFILGSAGVSDGNRYLHVKTSNTRNDYSMTMYKVTGYFPYGSWGEGYLGCYTYGTNTGEEPYGVLISNKGPQPVANRLYYSSDNYLCLCLDWSASYNGVFIEHIGAGGSYGGNIGSELQILSYRKTSSTAVAY